MDTEPDIIIIGINFWPEPTGNSVYTSDLARTLAQKYKVRVITGVPHYPWWRKQKDVNDGEYLRGKLNLQLFRRNHFVPSKHSNLNRFLMEVSFGFKVLLMGKLKADRILLVSPAMVSSFMVLLYLKLTRSKAKVIFWVQDLYEQGLQETGTSTPFATKIIGNIENWTLENSDKVVFPHKTFWQAKLNFGLKFKDVHIIPNWSQFHFTRSLDLQGTRVEYNLGVKKIILHIGNMGVKQGLENVVEAAKLADKRNVDVVFVLVGSGNQEDKLKAMSNGCNSIIFIPPVSDENLCRLLSAADILLVNEKPGVQQMSIPSKLTTYFQTGKPVVVCSEPTSLAALEVVDNEIGFWVESGKPDELLNLLTSLDTKFATETGNKAQLYAKNKLSTHVAMEKFSHALMLDQ